MALGPGVNIKRSRRCVAAASNTCPRIPTSLVRWPPAPCRAGAPGAGTILQDPELVKIIGTFPMSSLAAFGQMGWSRTQLDQLIAAL